MDDNEGTGQRRSVGFYGTGEISRIRKKWNFRIEILVKKLKILMKYRNFRQEIEILINFL